VRLDDGPGRYQVVTGHADMTVIDKIIDLILRDQRCAWPGGCGCPAAASGVHHLKHKKDGGPTSVQDCGLFCEFHHETCIHRWGWQVILHPDGTYEATSPDGRQTLRKHQPLTDPADSRRRSRRAPRSRPCFRLSNTAVMPPRTGTAIGWAECGGARNKEARWYRSRSCRRSCRR
jgi:hypothetical protein